MIPTPAETRTSVDASGTTEVPRLARRVLATVPGKLLAVIVFTGGMAVTNAPAWPAVGLVLVLTSLLPAWRRELVTVAALGAAVVAPPVDLAQLAALGGPVAAGAWRSPPAEAAWPLLAVVLALVVGCVFVETVRRRPKSLVGRRPVLGLVTLQALLLVAAGDAGLVGTPWMVVAAAAMTLSSYLWFFAYAACERRLRGAPAAWRQLGYWRPFWGFSNVPLGKGALYLERVEARDAEQLVSAQWSALRLLAWATVLTLAMDAFRFALYTPQGSWESSAWLWWLPAQGLPPIAVLLQAQAEGAPFAMATRWAAVLGEFVLTVLHMTTWGHGIIAICRMAGYRAALNTDRPLLSTSVAEFYNRYYFYFKELLATFFFYPTYLRFFRGRPRLRLFVATVMAAGVGNFLFHFYRDGHEVLRLGFLEALYAYRVYGCYALGLGLGIAISQMRLQKRGRRPLRGWRRARATAGVLVFYGLLGILDVRSPFDLSEYASLYVSLVVP